MKPITNDTQPKVCKASKEQPLLQSLPQVVSHGCFLKDFSKEVQCSSMEKYEKKKEVLEKIKTKKLKSAEMILTVTNKKVEENVAKSLSKGFLFEENVVEEWSPHHTNYKPDLSRLYTHLDTPKTTVLKLPQQAKHYKRHMPCHLTPMKDGYENSIRPIPSTESFLLGVSNSEERLKHIPPYMFSTMSTDTLKYVPTNELKPMKKSYGWDEHVLSLISKSTADIIVKDFTTQNQHHLKRFLEKKARKEKETDETGSTKESDDSSTETTTTQEILDPTLDRIETASTQSLLHELNKVKPATKRYKNILQQSFPLPPNQWSNLDSIQNQPDKSALKKGIRKWVDYPKEVKEKELVLHHALSDNFFKTSEKINLRTSTKQRNNANLLLAVDEWRSKWLLEKKWQTKTFEEIKEAMKSINDHVRLTAVSAAGKVILDKRNDRSLDEDVLKEEEDEMIEEIKKLYNDKSSYVAVASAITLYSINRADHKATELLLDTVKNGAHSERWIAVQCLAEYGRHDDCVIVELLSHIKTDNDPLERKKVEMFLTKLSNLTDSIQYMLSEQLNSTSWKDRYSACQMLPVLSGTMRKDIANKLSYLTWHDWSKNVRMAAAVALGKTGNGKLVHNALCKYLKSPKTSQQIEALRTVSKLGIVTAQLTVPFLQCLNSCNDTVCQEAIRVVRHVGLFSDDVINLLISLATSDRSLKIKVGAIKKKRSSVLQKQLKLLLGHLIEHNIFSTNEADKVTNEFARFLETEVQS